MPYQHKDKDDEKDMLKQVQNKSEVRNDAEQDFKYDYAEFDRRWEENLKEIEKAFDSKPKKNIITTLPLTQFQEDKLKEIVDKESKLQSKWFPNDPVGLQNKIRPMQEYHRRVFGMENAFSQYNTDNNLNLSMNEFKKLIQDAFDIEEKKRREAELEAGIISSLGRKD